MSDPIYLIDDDEDDNLFIEMTLKDLGLDNELKRFESGKEFLSYIKTNNEIPFIILCDVNIHSLDGFELRKIINEDIKLKYKSVPFIFWSNTVSEAQIQKAYDLAVHGFFVKGNTMDDMKKFIKVIIDYWKLSKTPLT